MASLDELRHYLRRVAPGAITDKRRIEEVLAPAWADLKGSTGEFGMEGRKLFGRMEDVEWNPPVLTFRIERHGGTVAGSTRAELQTWNVNADAGTADGGQSGFRQLYPQDARLDVNPLVDQVAALIKDHRTHDWLKWVSDVRVRVLLTRQ
jgi:hypothetical protein